MFTNGRARAVAALIVAGLAGLALWLTPGIAHAERNVVVARVAAPAAATAEAAAIEKDVTALVARRFWIVDAGLFHAAVGQRALGKLGKDDFRDIANRIGADAIVVSELELRRGGKRWLLVGQVVEGHSGRTLGKFRVELRERRLDSTAQAVLESQLAVIAEAALVGSANEERPERLTPRSRQGIQTHTAVPQPTPVGRSRLGLAVNLNDARPLDTRATTALVALAKRPVPAPAAEPQKVAEATRTLAAPAASAPAAPAPAPAPAPAVADARPIDAPEAAPVKAARLEKDNVNLDRAFIATLPERQLASAGTTGSGSGDIDATAGDEPKLLYRAVPPGRLTPNPAIELDLGLAVTRRDLAFSVAAGTPDSMRPASYEGAAAASGVLNVGAYPFVVLLPGRPALHGFGLGLGYERALGLDTTAQVAGEAQEFGTTQRRLDLDLRYRADLPFALRPTVEASVGYGRLGVVIDTGDMDIALPDVDYTLVTAGLRGRVPLSGRVSLTLSGRYLHALDAGEIEDSPRYGDTSARGLDLDAGVLVEPIARLVFRGGARYTRMSLDVSGAGITSALDEYLGGYITAGYLF